MTREIIHLEQISGSDYHLAAIEAWCESARNGTNDGRVLSVNWDDRISVLVERYDDKTEALISLCSWSYAKYKLTAQISQGWTDPRWRTIGRYSELIAGVEQEARSLGARFIVGGVHPNNHQSLAAMHKQGRSCVAMMMERRL